jgi:hypothetical protein
MEHLETYVQDHLALSLGGLRLARRCLGENQGTPLATFLARLVADLEEDRALLKEVASALRSGPSIVKEAVMVLGEWAGRFKPNGRIVGYSDLSRVWELEGLLAGTDSRRGLWKLLARSQKHDARLQGFDFERLEERARAHHEELERQRIRAADVAFGSRAAHARGAAPQPAR